MPVIINQLSVVVKTNVGEDPNADKKPAANESTKLSSVIDKDEIIREAVEQVLQTLRLQKER